MSQRKIFPRLDVLLTGSVFLSSSENAQANGKKTIMPHDVTAALKETEFEEFLPRLEAELKSELSSHSPRLRFVGDEQVWKRNCWDARPRFAGPQTAFTVVWLRFGSQLSHYTTHFLSRTQETLN